MTVHRIMLVVLYAATCLAVIYVFLVASEYYGLPVADRPHHYLHADWKPSGLIGHGLGVIGGGMMLVLLLYSVRKRSRWAHGMGSLRVWLDYHIWLGITGPILIVFHTAFKVGGLVSISFWSMAAVVFSGFIGRYIYIQIPHTHAGEEITANELVRMDNELQQQLEECLKNDDQTLALIQNLPGTRPSPSARRKRTLVLRLAEDLALPFTLRDIHNSLVLSGTRSQQEIATVIRVARERTQLRRRIVYLATAKRLLHHWHVLHKPFAVVMIVFMAVHVIVALIFGQQWILAPVRTASLF
jgi:hypothetical protein